MLILRMASRVVLRQTATGVINIETAMRIKTEIERERAWDTYCRAVLVLVRYSSN